jgi:hypothetical protein
VKHAPVSTLMAVIRNRAPVKQVHLADAGRAL